MRRILLCLGGLAALACATAPRPDPAMAPARTAPMTPAGFEKQPNETLAEYDLTRDGKPDLWKYALRDSAGNEVLLRKEKDLDGDGKIDTWEKYGPDGVSLVRAVYDLDFDGKPDVSLFYEREQLVRKELAFGFDGVPRSFNHYEKGKLVRKERDTNADGRIDTWEYWENGELDRIGVDQDGDGQVDRWDARRRAEAGAAEAEQPAAPAQK
jgi:hypothetical protein